MIKTLRLVFILLLIPFQILLSQNSESRFRLLNGKKNEKIPVKISGNQIILPISVNDSPPLNFILDSGVKTPILFELDSKDSISIKNYSVTTVQGLGVGEGIEALISKNNTVKIGSHVFNDDLTILILLEDFFHFSHKLGVDINGIIGYDVFKDFIVEINYDHSYIKLHDPIKYKYSKSSKWESLPLTFYKFKPYLDVQIAQFEGDSTKVKLLVDTGGSDALWLFPSSSEKINEPINYIDDFLGSGLSGDIFGKRSRIKSLKVGKYQLKNITVAYPDSNSVAFVMMYRERNGSIGGAALSRFKVIIDYPNKKISFRKGSDYKKAFNYNMSGIELKMPFGKLPIYEVSSIRAGSPAELAGVKVGDNIISINYTKASKYTYPQIMGIFREEEGTSIRLLVGRNGEEIKIKFRLKMFI